MKSTRRDKGDLKILIILRTDAEACWGDRFFILLTSTKSLNIHKIGVFLLKTIVFIYGGEEAYKKNGWMWMGGVGSIFLIFCGCHKYVPQETFHYHNFFKCYILKSNFIFSTKSEVNFA